MWKFPFVFLLTGQNLLPEEGSRMAIVSAIRYHQRKKMENLEVFMNGFRYIQYTLLIICVVNNKW